MMAVPAAGATATRPMRPWLNRKSASRIFVGVLVLTIAWICFQLAAHRHTGILRTLVLANHFFRDTSTSFSKTQQRTETVPAGPPHSVKLSWKASTTAGVAYNVYRRDTSGRVVKINCVPPTETSCVDNTVRPGETYYYVAKAVSAKGAESVGSNEVRVTVPSP